MKEFDEIVAKNMSQNQIMAVICEGLAEVSEKLAKEQPEMKGKSKKVSVREKCHTCGKFRTVWKKQHNLKRIYESHARQFRCFNKIFLADDGGKKDDKSR